MVFAVSSISEIVWPVSRWFQSHGAGYHDPDFAWTLKAMTDSLGAAVFVEESMRSVAGGIEVILPAIIFPGWMRTCFFANRYFLGTFGILIPIVVAVFEKSSPEDDDHFACQPVWQVQFAEITAHRFPIQRSWFPAGAQCDHVTHVSTQLPYAIVAAAVSLQTYIVAGFVKLHGSHFRSESC